MVGLFEGVGKSSFLSFFFFFVFLSEDFGGRGWKRGGKADVVFFALQEFHDQEDNMLGRPSSLFPSLLPSPAPSPPSLPHSFELSLILDLVLYRRIPARPLIRPSLRLSNRRYRDPGCVAYVSAFEEWCVFLFFAFFLLRNPLLPAPCSVLPFRPSSLFPLLLPPSCSIRPFRPYGFFALRQILWKIADCELRLM